MKQEQREAEAELAEAAAELAMTPSDLASRESACAIARIKWEMYNLTPSDLPSAAASERERTTRHERRAARELGRESRCGIKFLGRVRRHLLRSGWARAGGARQESRRDVFGSALATPDVSQIRCLGLQRSPVRFHTSKPGFPDAC